MIKKIRDGFFFGLGIFLFFGLIFGLVWAVGFHSAEEILGGTFLGNYVFNGNVEFEKNVTINGSVEIKEGLKLNSGSLECNANTEGSIQYNDTESKVQYCDGTDWRSVAETTTYSNDLFTYTLLHFDNNYAAVWHSRYPRWDKRNIPVCSRSIGPNSHTISIQLMHYKNHGR